MIDGETEARAEGLAYGAMVFRVTPGTTTEIHSHASEETWIVQAGAGHCTVDGKRTGLIAGARVIAPPHARHTITNSGSEDLVVLGFWWKHE
ncbi:cupin domain-containing protein [Streptomyces sp. NPDC059456]|uniref:cupin domain-containing protein n=1 Tax=Streptomyces sp. NPDC059456 TaxID=3346838 RepID=UPI00368FA209